MKRTKLSVSATRESLCSSFPSAAVFPSFFSRVSSVSQNKPFGGFVAPLLHPHAPVGTSDSKPTHWELGRYLQLLVFLAWTMPRPTPKLLLVGRKRTLFPLTPWTHSTRILAALALMPNLLTWRTHLLHLRMETHRAIVPQSSASTSPCCKNHPSCTVEDLDEQRWLDNTSQLWVTSLWHMPP